MIRQFNIRDLPLVHRLGEAGRVLEAEASLIDNPHPVRSALLNRIVGRQYYTYVWKAENGSGEAFAQLKCVEECSTARIVYLGTSQDHQDPDKLSSVDEDLWLPLLDDLMKAAGEHGAHNLIAEVSETGPELPVLRKAGFAVYTRQDIWMVGETDNDAEPADLQNYRELDDWDVFVLYSNIVPRLIQSVEPNPPINSGENWVLREGNELTTLIHIKKGTAADWMRLFIHPNADTKPKHIIRTALEYGKPTDERPIYCCVRRYQSWLQGPLQESGFKYWGSQVVMVKHTTKSVKQQATVKQLGLEAQAVSGSSTLIQGFSQSNGKSQTSTKRSN